MKTLVSFFFAAFLLVASTSYAQSQPSVFENAGMAKTADGAACVKLAWKKGSENTAYYLVERSVDGKEFKQIALVFTAEDTNFSDYKFNDKAFAAAGNAAYYRVTIVNDKKELTYLPVKKVDFGTANHLTNSISSDAVASRN